MPQHSFSNHATELLTFANIECLDSIHAINPDKLQEQGIRHVVTDFDGVISPYGEPIQDRERNKIITLSEFLQDGLSIVSNNPFLEHPFQDNDEEITVHKAAFQRLWDFKPFHFAIRHAMQQRDTNPEHTLAIGDGVTDMIAFRLAGIGNLAIVDSLGPHPLQKTVHERIYRPIVAPLGAAVLKRARAKRVALS